MNEERMQALKVLLGKEGFFKIDNIAGYKVRQSFGHEHKRQIFSLPFTPTLKGELKSEYISEVDLENLRTEANIRELKITTLIEMLEYSLNINGDLLELVNKAEVVKIKSDNFKAALQSRMRMLEGRPELTHVILKCRHVLPIKEVIRWNGDNYMLDEDKIIGALSKPYVSLKDGGVKVEIGYQDNDFSNGTMSVRMIAESKVSAEHVLRVETEE